jgi:competence protein ComEC
MRIERLRAHQEPLALFSLVLLTGVIWLGVLLPRESALEAIVLDVGQADCIFVRTPSGKTILIDGGGRYDRQEGDTLGLKVIGPFLHRQGVNRLDVVVLTHPHEDHVQGLARVLQDFHIGMVLDPAIPHPSKAYRDFLSVVEDRRIPYRRAVRGQVIELGDGVEARVLHPPDPRLSDTDDDMNNNSVVLRITYGRHALLLTGDAGIEAEQDMLAGQTVRADFLKVAHHGSDDGTSQEWALAVRPRVSAISVGKDNPFGHPSSDVVERLQAGGAKVYRTDRDGAITVRVTPLGMTVSAFK